MPRLNEDLIRQKLADLAQTLDEIDLTLPSS